MVNAEDLIASWDKMFNPASVAVVGASNGIGKWGFIIPLNLMVGGYRGQIYCINSKEDSVQGLPTYKRLADVPGPVDMALVTVPAPAVLSVVEQCAAIGTKNVVVISSGFSEASAEGKEMERILADRAHDLGVRLIGPNTMGICSPPTRLLAIGSFTVPPAGHVAFLSQSGNLGVQLLGWAERAGLGISRFIGSGNEASVTCDVALEYFGADPLTRVIIMYLEGIDYGARFLEVARRITPHKPVIALKMGVTAEGARAAASHSGAVSTPHRVYQAMVKQAGIIEAGSTEEMINLARTFGELPIPQGRRVGVMTMGGGWGVVTADLCAKEGLKLPPPSPATIEAVDRVLPSFWSHRNPVDLVGTVNRSAHYAVLEAMVHDPAFDSIITLGSLTGLQYSRGQSRGWRALRAGREILRRHHGNPLPFLRSFGKAVIASYRGGKQKKNKSQSGGLNLREAKQWSDDVFAHEIKRLMRSSGKPIVPVPFDPSTVSEIFKRLGLVAFGIPEEAVVALSKLTSYNTFLERIRDEQERDVVSPSLADTAVAIGARWKGRARALAEHEAKEVVKNYGIPIAEDHHAASEDEAVAAARRIGFPVVMKIDSPDIAHKSDAGGVVVGIKNEDEVRAAWQKMMASCRAHAPAARIDGALLQEMVTGGTEVMIGVSSDPHYGKTIVFGLGGIFVEVLDDVALRILPIELPDAEAMVQEIKAKKILAGVRGQKPRDVAALAEAIRRVGDLAWNLRDRIVELDINPLVVFEEGKGVKALDALIVVNEGQAANDLRPEVQLNGASIPVETPDRER